MSLVKRRSVVVTLYLFGYLLVCLSAGLSPLRDAVAGAWAPSDFATDFVVATHAWWSQPEPIDVATGNREAAALGAPGYRNIGVPFGAHPPPATLLVAALVPFGFRVACVAWLWLSLVALALVAWVAAKTAWPASPGRSAIPRRNQHAVAAMLFLALLLWPPFLHNIEKGQWSVIIAALVAAALVATERGQHARAAGLIVVAASFKIFPILILLGLVNRSTWRQITKGALITGASVFAVTTILLGVRPWINFIAHMADNTAGWQTGPANTLSLWGALSRALIGGPFARGLFPIPWGERLAVVAWLGSAAWLLIRWTQDAFRARPTTTTSTTTSTTSTNESPHLYRIMILAVALGPLAWSHTGLLLILPAAYAHSRTKDWRWRLTLALGCICVSLPRALIFQLAGSIPVSPARGLWLGLPLLGAFVLFRLIDKTQKIPANSSAGTF